MAYNGVLIPTDSPVFGDNVRARFPKGVYETEEMEAINQYLDGSCDLIDLGSSTRFLTAFVEARCSGPVDGVAVEANPDMIPVIYEVRRLNGCDFEVEHAAYQPDENAVEFYKHPKTVGGSAQRATDVSLRVPGISLTEVIEGHSLSNPVVISDIEGGEVDLVNGELNVLERKCPLLIIEFHGFAEGAEEAKKTLRDSSFNLMDTFRNVDVYRNKRFDRD
jgi:FkbM family methyltransferase